MEIEVGEWIRLNDGRIRQLKWTDGINAQWTRTFGEGLLKDIVKHSKDITDLIKVGDYVNGYKVISIDTNAPNNCKECIELDKNNAYEYQWISKNEIETILTKEQYMQNCYTVERKEE